MCPPHIKVFFGNKHWTLSVDLSCIHFSPRVSPSRSAALQPPSVWAEKVSILYWYPPECVPTWTGDEEAYFLRRREGNFPSCFWLRRSCKTSSRCGVCASVSWNLPQLVSSQSPRTCNRFGTHSYPPMRRALLHKRAPVQKPHTMALLHNEVHTRTHKTRASSVKYKYTSTHTTHT